MVLRFHKVHPKFSIWGPWKSAKFMRMSKSKSGKVWAPWKFQLSHLNPSYKFSVKFSKNQLSGSAVSPRPINFSAFPENFFRKVFCVLGKFSEDVRISNFLKFVNSNRGDFNKPEIFFYDSKQDTKSKHNFMFDTLFSEKFVSF